MAFSPPSELARAGRVRRCPRRHPQRLPSTDIGDRQFSTDGDTAARPSALGAWMVSAVLLNGSSPLSRGTGMRRRQTTSAPTLFAGQRSLANRPRELPLGAGELAWLVLELLTVGEQARHHGWCLGGLRPANLAISGGRLQRVAREPLNVAMRSRLRAHTHRREGHDDWCVDLGISRSHLWSLIRELQPADGGWLVLEALEAARGDARLGVGAAHESPRECVEYRIRARITPVPWVLGSEAPGEGPPRTSPAADRQRRTMPRTPEGARGISGAPGAARGKSF